MTRVCLLGDPDVDLSYELLSRETSREALATYDLARPFENTLAVRTVSVGAAVSLLNDLQWYLTRFVDEAFVREPSVDDEEWLSRELAQQLRNGTIDAEETGEYCKIYGLEPISPDSDGSDADRDGSAPQTPGTSPADASTVRESASSGQAAVAESADTLDPDDRPPATQRGPTRRLVEPLYVRRVGGDLPEYDLRDVSETLVVRIAEAEYGG
ncbi:DUF5804 family protein [Halobacteria archaeon AArc-dxtr1]|nr:DUF5804 family protein [Halobacteria archaeon AArc-dxtr1]